MAEFLLDANVLIALAWPQHQANALVGRWFSRHSHSGWATCPFTQAAFVRVLSNPAFSEKALTPQNAIAVLRQNIELPGHHFWPDVISLQQAVRGMEHRLTGHRQITDAYLLALALHHHGKFATLDAGVAAWGPSAGVEFIG